MELVGRGRSVREGEVQFPWSEVLAEASCAFPPNQVRLACFPLAKDRMEIGSRESDFTWLTMQD